MPDAKFVVNRNFKFGGGVKRADAILTVSADMVMVEIAKGRHEKTGNWISGLLNHCDPLDDFTAELVGEEKRPAEPSEDEKAEERRVIQAEMDSLGISWAPTWNLATLKAQLTKGKKAKGL